MEEFESVTSFYGDDSNSTALQTQLGLLVKQMPAKATSVQDVATFRRSSAPKLALFSAVVKLTRPILVLPATNAISERSFSAMRRIKIYLRSTMAQSQLNSVMILHVHKEKNDALSMVHIANDFVKGAASDHRKSMFGVFTDADLKPTM